MKKPEKISRTQKLERAHKATIGAFPSYESAINWLRTPNPIFGFRSPLDALDYDEGLDQVISELKKITKENNRFRADDEQ